MTTVFSTTAPKEPNWDIILSGNWKPIPKAILEFMRKMGRSVTKAEIEEIVPEFKPEMFSGINMGLRARGADCHVDLISDDPLTYKVVSK